MLPSDLSAKAVSGGTLSPEVHLEGTQPAPDGDVIQALNQAIISALPARGRS